jgi:tetratricopeptide (TPR) repeat protein
MRGALTASLLAATVVTACAGNPDRRTLAELRHVEPDMAEVRVENGLDQAMLGYRKYLDEAPESSLTPEAMRRLADLKLEKEYGILGDSKIVELPAPERASAAADAKTGSSTHSRASGIADHSETEADFERRAAGARAVAPSASTNELDLPGGQKVESSRPLEAIELYDRILATYPTYPHNDEVLYQKSRAFDELGRTEDAIAVMERLIAEYPHSRHIDEVQFRRAEYFFTRKKYLDAEKAYSAITAMGVGSEYYELALYKLGWTFYKQELHEEALHEYMALLDYKVSVGYDFDRSHDEDSERRIADTFRVISLSFSNLGGPEVLQQYFDTNGHRSYEDRIYSHLAEFYLEKLRYHDAARVYKTFVSLNPLHRSAPHFSMRVVEIYEAGGFPKLVLESKKEFAASYGLQSEYWRHFDVNDSPEVLSYLKTNLKDLANHYHSLYQDPELADEKAANFDEAARWYRAYLASFPADATAPAINHRLADLLLEHQDFGDAAREYERTAYDYPEHERAAAAGYAAIFAHREDQKHAAGDEQGRARREAVASTLRFVDAFPKDEHAAAVLGAAVDDLYEMKEFAQAIATGERLIGGYPDADVSIRRSAWLVVAHSSFEMDHYEKAEHAYSQALEMTPASDDSRQAVVDNLAAAIYKQGEQANAAQDYRAAAAHFLRVAQAAPTSKIRPLAEYDAGAALIRLEDWAGAASVLNAFRQAHPDHELNREATKQIAFVYQKEGELSAAAGEYERIAAEASDTEVRREALLKAGGLYENSKVVDRALAVYREYVSQFPEPVEIAVETRFKIAEMSRAANDETGYRDELRKIVEIDAGAGAERSARIRYLAARSALVLAEDLYHRFGEVALVQPFERSLKEKKRRMDAALSAFGGLVDYEVAEVTAAATFYMAEVYSDFSRALTESERPADLEPAERQSYETALEEEAFPFEERAISVHQKNLELMASGVYNSWIEKSLARLAVLMPGRYAKPEASSGWLASIDTYAYRPPGARSAPAPESGVAEGAPAAPDAATGEAAPAAAAGGAQTAAEGARPAEALETAPQPDSAQETQPVEPAAIAPPAERASDAHGE